MLRDDAVKEIESWIGHYEGQMADIKKHEPYLLELCDLLDGVGMGGRTTVTTSALEVSLPSVGEARVLLGKLLEMTKIEKFLKVSHTGYDRLRWSYHVDYHGVDLNIYPAEPSRDCIAVKRVSTYTSWVCEQA